MSAAGPHSLLLATAARQILKPMQLVQKGRSRLWVDDHGWWIVNVEFQPSSFSKGSYLNVGAQWLWRRSTGHSFDVGHRLEEFVPFVSEAQFQPEARRLMLRAADRVAELRAQFTTVEDVTAYYEVEAGGVPPSHSHQGPAAELPSTGRYAAAIANGLTGHLELARRLFDYWQAGIADSSVGWVRGWEHEGRELFACIDNEVEFRKAVWTVITEVRGRLKLTTWPSHVPIDPVFADAVRL